MSDPWRTSNSDYGSFLQVDGPAPASAKPAAGIPPPSSAGARPGSEELAIWKRGDGIRIVRLAPPTEAGTLGCERDAAIFWDGVRCGTLQYHDDSDVATIKQGLGISNGVLQTWRDLSLRWTSFCAEEMACHRRAPCTNSQRRRWRGCRGS
jgi:hypothetical protein